MARFWFILNQTTKSNIMKKLTIILTAGLLFVGAAGYAQSAGGATNGEKKVKLAEKYDSKDQAKAGVKKKKGAEAAERNRAEKKEAMIEKYGSEEAAKEAAREHRMENHESAGGGDKKEQMKAKAQENPERRDEMKATMQEKKKKKG